MQLAKKGSLSNYDGASELHTMRRQESTGDGLESQR